MEELVEEFFKLPPGKKIDTEDLEPDSEKP